MRCNSVHQDVSDIRLRAATAEYNAIFQAQDSPSSCPMTQSYVKVTSTWHEDPISRVWKGLTPFWTNFQSLKAVWKEFLKGL